MTPSLLALLLIVAFVLHDGEETLVMQRWQQRHSADIMRRFPRLKHRLSHLTSITTRGFAIAAAEEFVIIAAAAIMLFLGVPYAFYIVSALFIAFVVHQAIHLVQALILRSYVPGLLTNILLLPATITGMVYIIQSLSATQIAVCSATGIVVMAINLPFAHYIGRKLSQ